jgi:menaquinone-dependent protoporphyrinogen IX oxidase
MSRILLVYYSRTGYTASIAKQMANLENWDMEEVRDKHSRTGPWGFIRCVLDVLIDRHPAIQKTHYDPAEYTMVVIGASVWMKQLSSPIRTYIKTRRDQFKDVAFFCTYGGQGAENATTQCQDLVGKPLKAALAITDNEIEQATYWPKLDDFMQKIRDASKTT